MAAGSRALSWAALEAAHLGNAPTGRFTLDLERLFEDHYGVSDHALPAPLPDLPHLQLLHDQIEGRAAVQHDEWDGLERKGTTVLAATGVVLALVVNNAKAFDAYPPPAPTLFIVTLALLALGVGAGVITLWPREFKVAPEPGQLLAGYTAQPSDYTLARVLKTKADAFDVNVTRVRPKLWAIRAQLLLLAAAGGLLFVVLLIGR